MANVCKRVCYSGRVQGVGFRYTTRNLAREFPVSGYVRNLDNGDVELLAEGESADVTAFLAAVAERMNEYIRHAVIDDAAAIGLTDFSIRH
jgi:acylphosphatase